jgi:multidrug efflux pump subunit AcrA (membrane-fusion protein)
MKYQNILNISFAMFSSFIAGTLFAAPSDYDGKWSGVESCTAMVSDLKQGAFTRNRNYSIDNGQISNVWTFNPPVDPGVTNTFTTEGTIVDGVVKLTTNSTNTKGHRWRWNFTGNSNAPDKIILTGEMVLNSPPTGWPAKQRDCQLTLTMATPSDNSLFSKNKNAQLAQTTTANADAQSAQAKAKADKARADAELAKAKEAEIAKVKADKAQADAEVAKAKEAEIAKANADTAAAQAELAKIKAEAELAKANTEKLNAEAAKAKEAEIAKAKADTAAAQAELAKIKTEAELAKANTEKLKAEAAKAKEEADRTQAQLAALKEQARVTPPPAVAPQTNDSTPARSAAIGNVTSTQGARPNEFVQATANPVDAQKKLSANDVWVSFNPSISVQERQFCRIVENFRAELVAAKSTNNQIKVNETYKTLTQALNSLLPDGKFQGWVMRTVGVAQAKDGSAEVLMELPCNVYVGSNACDTNPKNFSGLIPEGSRMYTELAKMTVGDFVLTNGEFVYSDNKAFDKNRSVASFQYMPAASHCKAKEFKTSTEFFGVSLNTISTIR